MLPALALYPSLNAFTVDAKEHLVESQFAPMVASLREDLQSRRLPQAHFLETLSDTSGHLTPRHVTPATDRSVFLQLRSVHRNFSKKMVDRINWGQTPINLTAFGSKN